MLAFTWVFVRTLHPSSVSIPFEASLSNLSTVLIIRDFDSEFSRVSALASAEWSRSSNLRVIGPTEKWCQKWATEILRSQWGSMAGAITGWRCR